MRFLRFLKEIIDKVTETLSWWIFCKVRKLAENRSKASFENIGYLTDAGLFGACVVLFILMCVMVMIAVDMNGIMGLIGIFCGMIFLALLLICILACIFAQEIFEDVAKSKYD